MYKRKTYDVWDIQVDYFTGSGFETVCTEENINDAIRTTRDYIENVEDYGQGKVRCKKRRVPINT